MWALSSAKPTTQRSTNARSCRFLSRMWWSIPRASARSVWGLGAIQSSATAAVGVRRGSTTTSRAPVRARPRSR